MGCFFIEYSVLATTYFRPEGLSSAQQRLTSLCGMGRGVTTALNHQDTVFEIRAKTNLNKKTKNCNAVRGFIPRNRL